MARPFPTIRGAPGPAYDAVVVGAGIGGLTCAALLARAGLRVLLVEQHYMVGGYCSTFRRNGYHVRRRHAFLPAARQSRDDHRPAARASSASPTGWIKMDPVDHFHLPDGTRSTCRRIFDTYRRAHGRDVSCGSRRAGRVLRCGAVGLSRRAAAPLPLARDRESRPSCARSPSATS